MPGIQVYFSPEELGELQRQAKLRNEPLNRVIREACIAGARGEGARFQAKTRALVNLNTAVLIVFWLLALLTSGSTVLYYPYRLSSLLIGSPLG